MFGALQQLDPVTAVSTDRRITVPSIDLGSISCVYLFMIWQCHFIGHLLDLRFIFFSLAVFLHPVMFLHLVFISSCYEINKVSSNRLQDNLICCIYKENIYKSQTCTSPCMKCVFFCVIS